MSEKAKESIKDFGDILDSVALSDDEILTLCLGFFIDTAGRTRHLRESLDNVIIPKEASERMEELEMVFTFLVAYVAPRLFNRLKDVIGLDVKDGTGAKSAELLAKEMDRIMQDMTKVIEQKLGELQNG